MLTPDSLASATNGVLVTIGNAANISTDVAFFSDGARLAFAPSDAAQAVVVGRRALQGLGPDAQAALAALLTAMTAKARAPVLLNDDQTHHARARAAGRWRRRM